MGGVSDDFALQIIERGKESDRPVAIVIVGLGADMPFAQRQTRLAALKSLDLAFLVTTKHHCPLGRIEVKTDDIPKLRLKVWIGGSLKTRVRCGLISFSLQTRCTVALETPNSRAIERQVHRARPCGGRLA